MPPMGSKLRRKSGRAPREGTEKGKWITRDRTEVPVSSTHSPSNPEDWGTFDSCFPQSWPNFNSPRY